MNWTDIYEQYNGSWVALTHDESRVVASGATAQEALEQAQDAGTHDPILTRVPKELVSLVGHHEV